MKENIIYSSKQYDDFIFKEENRSIDESHVDKIVKSFEKYGWIGSPIEVSETKNSRKLQIEEGQHRYLAAKKLGLPISFILVPPRNAVMQAEINDLVDRWKAYKFIEMYARNGVQSYKRLQNLIIEFPNYPLSEILAIVTGDHQRKFLIKGNLRLESDGYIRARNILKDLSKLKDAMESIGMESRSYRRAFAKLLKCEVIDVDRMLEKIEKYGRGIFEKVSTVDRAVDYIERVYNYNSKKDIVYLMEVYKRAKRTQYA